MTQKSNDMSTAPALRMLLNEVVVKYEVDQRLEFALVENQALTDDEREQLMDALALEFSATGLCQNDEPNMRGLQLEELIDLVIASSRKTGA